jgi:hypothetical protein
MDRLPYSRTPLKLSFNSETLVLSKADRELAEAAGPVLPSIVDALHPKFTQNYLHLICGGALRGVNVSVFVKVPSSKETMTEKSWSLFACAAIIALIIVVFIQQSWVKRRPIEAAHERATERESSQK